MERRKIAGVLALMDEVEHMFLGQYRHSFDSKGRLTVPSRFREVLDTAGAYVMQGLDRNLMVLTEATFDKVSQRVNQMSVTEPNARLLKRLIFSTAERVESDKAGRILIPEFLRTAANLGGDAVFVGAGEFFEIWSPESWAQQVEKLQDADANEQRFAVLDLSI